MQRQRFLFRDLASLQHGSYNYLHLLRRLNEKGNYELNTCLCITKTWNFY